MRSSIDSTRPPSRGRGGGGAAGRSGGRRQEPAAGLARAAGRGRRRKPGGRRPRVCRSGWAGLRLCAAPVGRGRGWRRGPGRAGSRQARRRPRRAARRPRRSRATTVLIATVCPSGTLISSSVPATGDGISASTLSVEISKIGSSRLTGVADLLQPLRDRSLGDRLAHLRHDDVGGHASPFLRLIAGGLLLILGVLFALQNLGVLRAGHLGDYWPLLLVWVGLTRMLGRAAATSHPASSSSSWASSSSSTGST